MPYDLFRNNEPKKKAALYDLVGGSFECSYCRTISDEARYYPVQKLLSWDCNGCQTANNIEGFSLD